MSFGEEKLQLIKTGKVSSVLLKLGLPAMIGLLISASYNVVDTFL